MTEISEHIVPAGPGEASVLEEVTTVIGEIFSSGFEMPPFNRRFHRMSAWDRDFYKELSNRLSAELLDDKSISELTGRDQSRTVGEIAEASNVFVSQYSDRKSSEESGKKGLCITWDTESVGEDHTRLSQTFIQVNSQTEGWQALSLVNTPQLWAEYKTVHSVVSNDEKLGLQKDIPTWLKVAGGVGAAALVAVGTRVVLGKLKSK